MDKQRSEETDQAVLRRLAKIEGHVRSLKRLVTEGRDCSEFLVQLAAVQSALTRVGKLMLNEHVESCLAEAASSGRRDKALGKLQDALHKFIR